MNAKRKLETFIFYGWLVQGNHNTNACTVSILAYIDMKVKIIVVPFYKDSPDGAEANV